MTYAQIRDEIRKWVWQVVRYSRVAGTSANGHDDSVEGRGDGSTGQTAVTVRRAYPFGFDSRAPVGTEAFVIHLGQSNGAMIGSPSPQYAPSLNSGACAIYCKGGAVVKLDENGAVTVTAASGQNIALSVAGGGVVAVGGSSYALPHWDDYMTDLATFVAALKVAVNIAAVQAAATTFETAINAAAQYKSGVAKNG